jgi:hypothetical protein
MCSMRGSGFQRMNDRKRIVCANRRAGASDGCESQNSAANKAGASNRLPTASEVFDPRSRVPPSVNPLPGADFLV